MVCFIVSYYIDDNIVNFQLFSDKTFFYESSLSIDWFTYAQHAIIPE